MINNDSNPSAATVNTSTTLTMTSSNPTEPYMKMYWLISEFVLVFVTCFTIYLLVCLARYALISRCKPGRELNHKKGKTLYRLCFISVIMALGRFGADQAVAVVGWQTDQKCYTSVATSTVFYTLSLYPVYIFLWMRQSIFYANPVLSHILNPVVTFISYATLFVMLSGGAALGVLYILPNVTGWEHLATDSGCRDVNNQRGGFDLVPMLVVCFVVSFQISLLALFLYPLLTKKMRKYRGTSNRSGSDRGSKGGAHSKDFSSTDSIHHNGRDKMAGIHASNNLNTSNAIEKSRPQSIADSYPNSDTDFATSRSGTINTGSPTADDMGEGKPPRIGRNSHAPRILCRDNSDKKMMRWQKTREQNMARMAANNAASEAAKRNPGMSDGNSSETEGRRPKSKRSQRRNVMKFIRKAFFLTLTCVVSDVLGTVIQMTSDLPELAYLVVFDFNLLVNIVCIIMSFRDWPKMIFPFCSSRITAMKKKRKRHNTLRLSQGKTPDVSQAQLKENIKLETKVPAEVPNGAISAESTSSEHSVSDKDIEEPKQSEVLPDPTSTFTIPITPEEGSKSDETVLPV